MADDSLPDDLREFILRYIDSVAHLEALLLLHGNPEETWTVARSAQRLYVTEQQASDVLNRLCADGFLSCENDVYRYAGQSQEQRAVIDRLAEAYTRQLIPITNIIHARPRRIREFADAFKFRKDR
jgi:hypothetical protein